MANNKMKIFTATKQIESITIHYNERLDGSFVRQLEEYIVRVAKKISGVDLKSPKEVKTVNVFIYPDSRMFNRIFNSAIEKRWNNGHRGMEDMYIVRDDEGNIHMASPRGKSTTKVDALSKILVVKILGEYMDENKKHEIQNVTRAVYKDKEAKLEKAKKEAEEKEKEEAEEREREEEEERQRAEEEEREKEEREQEEARLEAELEDERLRQEEEERQRAEEEKPELLEVEKEILQEEKELPTWLVIGWQGYFSGQLKKVSDKDNFAKYMEWRGYIKPSKVTESVDQEFAVAQVEYIIETYGMENFKKILANPDEMYKTLNVSKFNFDRAVKTHIFKNYNEPEKKIEIDKYQTQKELRKEQGFEVTVITTDNDGNFVLPEENEIQKIKE